MEFCWRAFGTLLLCVWLSLFLATDGTHDKMRMLMEDDSGVPCHIRNPCKCFNWQRSHANLTMWLAVGRKMKKSTRCYLNFPSDCEFGEFQKHKPLHGWCASNFCNMTTMRCTKFIPPKPRRVKKKTRLFGLGGNSPDSKYLCTYMENLLITIMVCIIFYLFF